MDPAGMPAAVTSRGIELGDNPRVTATSCPSSGGREGDVAGRGTWRGKGAPGKRVDDEAESWHGGFQRDGVGEMRKRGGGRMEPPWRFVFPAVSPRRLS